MPLSYPFEYNKKKLTEKQITTILQKGKSSLIKGFEHDGKKVDGYIKLGEAAELTLEVKADTPLLCPKCKKGSMIKGKKAYGCERYREGCHFTVPFIFMQKQLTDNQIKALILKGKSPLIKNFIQPNGETTQGKLLVTPSFTLELER